MTRITLPAAAVASLAALAAPAALAQSGTQTMPEPATEAMPYEEATLEAFVAAAAKINEVVAEFSPQLEEAGNQQERDAIEEAANREIMAAIESTDGIDAETYGKIARAAQQNDMLYKQLRRMMAEG